MTTTDTRTTTTSGHTSHKTTSSPSMAGRAGSVGATLVGAGLALAVSAVHVLDQGGVSALKDPTYMGQGYRLLEIAGVVVAVLLLAQRRVVGWVLALGVAAGPLAGYVVTRTVGLPGARDDIGNWGETLGVASLLVESALLLLALGMLAAANTGGRVGHHAAPYATR